MSDGLKITITIPERSEVQTLTPAIGLAAAVSQRDNNPFDLAEALARQAVEEFVPAAAPISVPVTVPSDESPDHSAQR